MPTLTLQCVIVLYKQSVETSTAFLSLLEILSHLPPTSAKINLLFYDNSPSLQEVDPAVWPFGKLQYIHNPANGGLAVAYSAAVETARLDKTEWLLLLDQDSTVNESFWQALLETLASDLPSNACAVVPKLMQNDIVLSPQRVGSFRNFPLSKEEHGLQLRPVTAFNSAACLRIQSIEAIGGFPANYWLDYLDHAVFHKLHTRGWRVFILNASVEHHHSMMNIEQEMGLDRFSNLLLAEWRFIRDSGWGGGPFWHRFRLLRRSCKYALQLSNKRYSVATFQAIFQ